MVKCDVSKCRNDMVITVCGTKMCELHWHKHCADEEKELHKIMQDCNKEISQAFQSGRI